MDPLRLLYIILLSALLSASVTVADDAEGEGGAEDGSF